jgi:Cu(I)/Ag(I) efflux system membrane fusion protein
MPAAEPAILYYRDPSGAPSWSATPKKDAQGRDYLPVHDNEELSFDPEKKPQTTQREGKVLYFRNPMGLPDTSPVPKKDSMGMDYIPVYEGEDDEGATIKISPGKLQRTGVRSEPAERRQLSIPVRAPGSIQLDERRVAVVSLRSQGFVEKVEAITTGEKVRKGQPLMRLYSPDIAAAAAQYLSVVNQPAASGPGMVESSRRRLENLDVPADVLAEIERTRKVPITITWPAPRDSIVLERNISDGMRAMPGETLFRLADISTIWALVDVTERDLANIAVGQPVIVRPRGAPDRTFTGTVALVYPQINRETRTARVRVELANPDGALLPDMYVEAEIATGAEKAVITVPASAVIARS